MQIFAHCTGCVSLKLWKCQLFTFMLKLIDISLLMHFEYQRTQPVMSCGVNNVLECKGNLIWCIKAFMKVKMLWNLLNWLIESSPSWNVRNGIRSDIMECWWRYLTWNGAYDELHMNNHQWCTFIGIIWMHILACKFLLIYAVKLCFLLIYSS